MYRLKRKCGYLLSILIFMYLSLFGISMLSKDTINSDYQCRNDFNKSEINLFSCATENSKQLAEKQRSEFPRYIHQMFFYETDKTIPKILEAARRTWISRQSHFRYTLWTATMVENLIKTKYCELLELYLSYKHWVRRADMARYIVLYEYGGIYVDIDIQSKYESLTDLISGLKNTSGIALYVTQPAVVTNDFIIAKPKHPFMKSVLCGLKSSNHWYGLPYVTTMMSTGPLYLHRQYRRYEPEVDIEILNSTKLLDFIRHIQGASWHQWDGKVIWWIFQNMKLVALLCLAVISTVMVLLCLWKYRYEFRFSNAFKNVEHKQNPST